MAITDTTGHTHFDAAQFDAEIEAHGTPALWRKAADCPCVDDRTGQPNPMCPFHVRGVIWDTGSSIKVLAPGRQRREIYDEAGEWMQGFIVLTFPSAITPGHQDRVDFTAAEMVVNNEVLTRGAVDRLDRSLERVRVAPVLEVERCIAIVNDAVVDYISGLDFSVGADGAVTWAAGRGPAAGTQYSLRVRVRPTYVIWAPQSRDEGGSRQPYRAMAQRMDFFRRLAVGEV
jgi:hypothetical protein